MKNKKKIIFAASALVTLLVVLALTTDISTFKGSLGNVPVSPAVQINNGGSNSGISWGNNQSNTPTPSTDNSNVPGTLVATDVSNRNLTLLGNTQEMLRFRLEARVHNFEFDRMELLCGPTTLQEILDIVDSVEIADLPIANNRLSLFDARGRAIAVNGDTRCKDTARDGRDRLVSLTLANPILVQVGIPQEFIIKYDTRGYNSDRRNPVVLMGVFIEALKGKERFSQRRVTATITSRGGIWNTVKISRAEWVSLGRPCCYYEN